MRLIWIVALSGLIGSGGEGFAMPDPNKSSEGSPSVWQSFSKNIKRRFSNASSSIDEKEELESSSSSKALRAEGGGMSFLQSPLKKIREGWKSYQENRERDQERDTFYKKYRSHENLHSSRLNQGNKKHLQRHSSCAHLGAAKSTQQAKSLFQLSSKEPPLSEITNASQQPLQIAHSSMSAALPSNLAELNEAVKSPELHRSKKNPQKPPKFQWKKVGKKCEPKDNSGWTWLPSPQNSTTAGNSFAGLKNRRGELTSIPVACPTAPTSKTSVGAARRN